MSDYLRSRFPLADTSTVYMSGEAEYHLVRYNRPGLIASVRMLPERAQMLRDAVREALADAWDQGYAASQLEWEHVYDGHSVDPDEADGLCTQCGQGNPYRKEQQ